MFDFYNLNSYLEVVKMCDDANEKIHHASLRPRQTKYCTTAFYNFRHKKIKSKFK